MYVSCCYKNNFLFYNNYNKNFFFLFNLRSVKISLLVSDLYPEGCSVTKGLLLGLCSSHGVHSPWT